MIALNFAQRGVKIFFRSKASVFFSILSALIIIALYVLFLRNISFKGAPNMELVDIWTMSGVIGINIFTTAFGALEIMVNDESNKLNKDFLCAPVSRGTIVLGYILSAVIISVIMSLITFVFAQIYILIYGGEIFGIIPILETIGIIIIGAICSSSIAYFIVSFIKNTNAFAVASTIMGTLIGFVTGAYFPLSVMPEAAQYVVKVFPVSHIVVLIRQALCNDILSDMQAEFAEAFRKEMGINFWFSDYQLPWWASLLFIIALGAIFFFAAAQKLKIKKRG